MFVCDYPSLTKEKKSHKFLKGLKNAWRGSITFEIIASQVNLFVAGIHQLIKAECIYADTHFPL